jgi:hypothetical protein
MKINLEIADNEMNFLDLKMSSLMNLMTLNIIREVNWVYYFVGVAAGRMKASASAGA